MAAFSLFVSTCFYHLFVMLFAGSERRGFGETFKLLAYAFSPGAFIASIPVVNFFGSICGIVLAVIGIREVHRTTTGRAVLTVAVPVIIVVLLSIVAAVTAAVLDASLPGSTQTQGNGGGRVDSPVPGQSQSNDSGGEESGGSGDSSGSAQPSSNPSGTAPTYATELPDVSTSASPGLAAQNMSFERDDAGNLTFQGEILNKGDEDAVAPIVDIRLYNDKDERVGQTTSYTSLPSIIEPGSRAVWDEPLSEDEAPEDWSRTEIEVVEDNVLVGYKKTDYPELETSEAKLNPGDEYSTPTITAKISNTGDKKPEVIRASAGLYDAEGKLVDVVTMVGSGSDTVAPGESTIFEGYIDNPEVDPEKEYDIALYLTGTLPS